ncbi:hypothetical protein BOX15_Mlig032470g1 [Macrostomum lignano]|uniref:RNA helicase n=1 Tax=Macrostomum lignano TaxID=282301 RepID=A0A267GTP6_9PLAT|nr:hypothetical protein BOX15_Mlig032470g1 [Macrostomum lignano]
MDVRMLDYSVLILSNLNPPLEPAITFSDTNLSTEYASALSLHGFRNLKPGQTYLASAVKRGTNALLISGEGKGKSAACLMTALTLVEQPLRNLPSRTHPTCIWVCKNWITAKDTYNFAKKLVSSTHLKVAPLLDDGCIADAEIAIAATGCQLLVAAIKPLVRLLSSELASPMRNICYLLLDDLDVMLRDSKDGLKELLLAHRAALFDRRGDGKDLLPRQVIATATRWTPELDDFLRCDLSPMRSAVEIFESRTQAAIRCGVMHLVQPPNSLIDTLSNLEAGLRVAICVEEETAARALYHQLHRDLATKVYPQLVHSELDADGTKLLINAWKQMRTNCVKVLIIPDCLIMLHRLDDADALVMLDLPVGPCFTSRFCLLGAAMRRFDPDDNSGRQRPPRCFYTWSDELEFVSKPVAKRLKHFYDFLSSCVAYSSKSVPGGEDLRQLLELPDDASGAAAVDELDRSLCRTLLSFGRCGRLKCSDLRHRIVQKRDAPPRRLPVSGSTIRFKVLQVFSGNWVTIHLLGESYLLNQMSLAMHFANERNTRIGKSGEPKVGEVCAAYLEGSGYHRVKIREVQEPTSSTDTRRVTLDLVDSGRTVLRYPAGDLLALPESLSLHAVPPMSINAVILNLAPGCSAGSKNREFDWDLYSLEYLKTLTDGVELTARVAFAIGEWLLLADVEHYEPLPASGLETGFSLMQRMIESGGASFNPEHERNLLRLCQGQLDVKGPPPDSRWISRYFSYDASSASLPVAQLTEGDLVMIVGSPIRPDKFHACRDADWDNLWKMQDEIESFTSMFKPVPADCLRPGLLVLAPYQGDSGDEPPSLNRACIVTIDSGDIRPDNNSSCTVNFVDFGDQQPAALSELRLLPDQYRRLPAQAIACCLAHCSPADPATGWSDQAVADFTDMFFDNCEPPNRKVYSVRIVSKEASQQEYRPDSSGRPRYTVQLSGTLEDRQFDPAFELVRARHAALHSVYLLSRLGLPSDWRPGQTNGGGGIRELAAQILLGNGDSPPSLLVDAAQIVVANDNSDNVELLSNALVALLLLMSHLTAEADVACVLEALSELLVGRPAKVAQLLSASNSFSELLAMLTACLDRNQGGGPAHAPAARVLRLALSASPEMTAAMRSRLDLVPLLGRELVGEAAAEFCRCCGHLLAGDPDADRYGALIEPLVHRVRSDTGTIDDADNYLADAAVAIDALARHPPHRRAIKRSGAFDALMLRLLQLLGRPGGPACTRAIDSMATCLARLWRNNLADKAAFKAVSQDRFCSLVPAGASQKALRDLHAMVLSEPVLSHDFKPDMYPLLLPQMHMQDGLPAPSDILFAQTSRRVQLEISCQCLVQLSATSRLQLTRPCPILIDEQRMLFRTGHCQLWLPLPHPIVPRRTVCRLTSGVIVVALYKRDRAAWSSLAGLREIKGGNSAADDGQISDDSEDEDASDMASLRSLERILQLGARRRRNRNQPRLEDDDDDDDGRFSDSSADSDWDIGPPRVHPGVGDEDDDDSRALTRNYLNSRFWSGGGR